MVEKLIERIKANLGSTDDFFFQKAFKHAEVLRNNVKYRNRNEGGSYINGTMYVGNVSLKDKSGKDNSDDDVMTTIFHEFMHYIGDKENVYKKRYSETDKDIIYSEIIEIEKRMQSTDEFNEYVYKLFLQEYSVDEKYWDYPAFYDELDKDKQKEVEEFRIKKNLSPVIAPVMFQYSPSNHHKDEINAHSKTLKAQNFNLFKMSESKITFYKQEIKRYENNYKRCLEIEKNRNYNPDGCEIK